jgi:hypothetical protein
LFDNLFGEAVGISDSRVKLPIPDPLRTSEFFFFTKFEGKKLKQFSLIKAFIKNLTIYSLFFFLLNKV